MRELTLLEVDQIIGNDKLQIFKQIGPTAELTDFSILLGGYVYEYITSDKKLGCYWTKTPNNYGDAYFVDQIGFVDKNMTNDYAVGIRPVISLDYTYTIPTNNKVIENKNDRVLEVEYGYYPRNAASKDLQKVLENQYKNGFLLGTGRSYTTNHKPLFSKKLSEYKYAAKKYVRVNSESYDDIVTLSNGKKYKHGDYVWIEVEPVKWLVDTKSRLMVTKEIIMSGIQFKALRNYKGDFNDTDIKKFIDKYLSKEMLNFQTMYIDFNDEKNEEKIEDSRKQNPYNFKFDEVSEEDIIRSSVESGISVLLHGKSSEGKSARVKQLDPDCEIIYLANATPESLNGKSVAITDQNTFDMMKEMYDKGEITFDKLIESSKKIIDIKPTWLVNLEERCEKEKDKIHIVFLDEITNALPSIQNMAFNLVLDREVNGKWKLPENARIVAAGNELTDSLSANELTEPLYNRFCHVYIETTVESWLKWAVTDNNEYKRLDYVKEESNPKIHPAVYAFIAYKRMDALRTEYTGVKPNADPRKWEMASKVLYKTGNPNMIRGLVGEDVTYDFVDFCKSKVITVEDIINNNYTDRDLEMNLSEKYATTLGLSRVSDEHVDIVRSFVEKLGPELVATFDSIWTYGNEDRLLKIAEIRVCNSEEGIKQLCKKIN